MTDKKNMTSSAAKRIGFKKTLKYLLIIWVIFEFVMMLQQTSGDFANGILFFIANHFYYPILAIYLSIFVTTLFFGRKAGHDILISGRNKIKTACKYIVLSLLIVWLTIFILTRIDNMNWNWDNYSQILVLAGALSLPIIVIWILAVYSIGRAATRSEVQEKI